MAWSDVVLECLKANKIQTLVHIPDTILTDPKAFQPRRPALIKHRFMGKIGTMEDVKRLVWE